MDWNCADNRIEMSVSGNSCILDGMRENEWQRLLMISNCLE